ncbi:hypothetical protein MYU51_006409 [Penicillium brevicompactum]|uniref:uncharacterized protein n=1 Tax=Penicillium brevicompactum TaxID=5074 RepID=UPI00253FC6CD|nr:uncharacterized protein N7506_005076 [Penicillium brevicompactum]KAJ5337054.1 hypothetical protein N7506_005076 [Penicillium brevicompactum]
MTLIQLPIEILWIIASCFYHQRDIFAFIQTNRHLHKTLIQFLYNFHAQYKHGAVLFFLAERNLVFQVQNLLHGLDIARNQPQPSLAVIQATEAKAPKRYEDEDEDEDEDEYEYDAVGPRRREKWDQTDVLTHPLFQKGYSTPTIVHVQHALVVAIRAGHAKIVDILLDFGAQANFYCKGRTPYTHNRWHDEEVDYPPLFTAVQAGNLELVKLLLQRGADPERYHPSPLYRAVKDDKRGIIPTLLEHGVGPQATALKLAVLQKDESMVRLLLDGGFNIAQYGHSGLYAAQMQGDQEMVDLLESRGATLAALTEKEKESGAREDGDGTLPIPQRLFISYADEIEEEEDDDVQVDDH